MIEVNPRINFNVFGDDYEIIEVSDLDKIQIAGFSKQELLEMCNFCMLVLFLQKIKK